MMNFDSSFRAWVPRFLLQGGGLEKSHQHTNLSQLTPGADSELRAYGRGFLRLVHCQADGTICEAFLGSEYPLKIKILKIKYFEKIK